MAPHSRDALASRLREIRVNFEWNSVFSNLGMLLDGLVITLGVSILSFVGAFPLSVTAALARRSQWLPIRFIAASYVEIFRNTPGLVQIFFVFFALPSFGIRLDAFTAGVVALTLNIGAYMSETMRAGIQSVPVGQLEAAASLGLNGPQIFTRVVLPRALRNVYPAIVNLLVATILASSLLSTIAVPELTGTATVINSRTLRTFEVFAVVTVMYVVLTNAGSSLLGLLGRFLFPAERYA
jgi:amine acid ABC transporter, permease protein, 3-TM region, His/Glu/Gln/Arg/opine family